MRRTYRAEAPLIARQALERLMGLIEQGQVEAYRETMVVLGGVLGDMLSRKLPPETPVVLVCTVEDADFLASGVIEQLARHRSVTVACFWNHRRTIGKRKVAPVLRRYVEPFPETRPVLVVVKSAISGSCVVRTNLVEVLSQMEDGPEQIHIVSPVMHVEAPQLLAQEFPQGWSEQLQYTVIAVDEERDGDGHIYPGVGNPYTNLGWNGQAAKNRYRPRLVAERNQRFLQSGAATTAATRP